MATTRSQTLTPNLRDDNEAKDGPMTQPEEYKTHTQIVDRLTQKHPELDEAMITRAVEDAYRGLSASPIRDFVPVLVERAASEQLAGRYQAKRWPGSGQ